MTLPDIPPISPAQIPLLILLTIAGAGCLALIAELRGRLVVAPRKTAAKQSTSERVKAGLGSLLVIVLASTALFLIGGLIGLKFGTFYLIVCAALALIAIFTGLGNPNVARHVERLSTVRLTLRITALVIACLTLALFFEGLGRSPL